MRKIQSRFIVSLWKTKIKLLKKRNLIFVNPYKRQGGRKSKRDKLSYVDIIADDKKLIEGYTAIVKEMAIHYGVA